jgi:hypothetical protein
VLRRDIDYQIVTKTGSGIHGETTFGSRKGRPSRYKPKKETSQRQKLSVRFPIVATVVIYKTSSLSLSQLDRLFSLNHYLAYLIL